MASAKDVKGKEKSGEKTKSEPPLLSSQTEPIKKSDHTLSKPPPKTIVAAEKVEKTKKAGP